MAPPFGPSTCIYWPIADQHSQALPTWDPVILQTMLLWRFGWRSTKRYASVPLGIGILFRAPFPCFLVSLFPHSKFPISSFPVPPFIPTRQCSAQHLCSCTLSIYSVYYFFEFSKMWPAGSEKHIFKLVWPKHRNRDIFQMGIVIITEYRPVRYVDQVFSTSCFSIRPAC